MVIMIMIGSVFPPKCQVSSLSSLCELTLPIAVLTVPPFAIACSGSKICATACRGAALSIIVDSRSGVHYVECMAATIAVSHLGSVLDG